MADLVMFAQSVPIDDTGKVEGPKPLSSELVAS